MTTIQKVIAGITGLVLLALGGHAVFGAASVNSYEAGVKWFGNGIFAGLTQQFSVDKSGNASTTALYAAGRALFDGGVWRSSANSTSTIATTQTLTQADLDSYDTILLTPNTGALTLTFPASSTVSTWLPNAGDMQETCIRDATTTAAATITFAAGTGIDLETASSTRTDLTLLAGNTACFKFIRQKATATAFDISVLMTEFMDGD